MITNLRVVCSVLYCLLVKLTCKNENSVDPDQLASSDLDLHFLQCTVYICFHTVLESIYTLFQHSKVGISKSFLLDK